jgi:hypothetical protein
MIRTPFVPSVLFLVFLGFSAACSKRSGPLPGDSVSDDGGITLSPPRMSTAPRDARESQGTEARGREALGPIESLLFPPELVMDHQGELGIDSAQKDAILKEIERGQGEMVRLQWDLQGEKEKLVKVLDAERVDEPKSAAAAVRVMERENRVKASHLGMLVRVKNLLSSAQQRKLRELRDGIRSVASDAGPTDAAPAK